MVLYKISSPMNRYRKRVMIGCLIGMVITSISMKNLFSLTSVSPTALLLLAILFFAADSTFQHLSTISEKVQLWFYKKRLEQNTEPKLFWFGVLFLSLGKIKTLAPS